MRWIIYAPAYHESYDGLRPGLISVPAANRDEAIENAEEFLSTCFAGGYVEKYDPEIWRELVTFARPRTSILFIKESEDA
jgi:hypothetical protein